MRKYYVYAYLDPRHRGHFCYDTISFIFEPFYIGKGSNGRLLVHLNDAIRLTNSTSHKLNKIRAIRSEGLEPIIIKIQDGLAEKDALQLENGLILEIGRRDLKNGPLTNKFDKKYGITEESRKDLRDRFSGLNNPRFGKKHTEESKRSMSRTKRILIEAGLLKCGGHPSNFKGKTYNEIFGEEKAIELKKSRREAALKNSLGVGGRQISEEEKKNQSKRMMVPVEINGVTYEGTEFACEQLGVSLYKLHKYYKVRRLRTSQWS